MPSTNEKKAFHIKKNKGEINEKLDGEISLHREIRIKQRDSVRLYLANRMGKAFPCKKWKNKGKLQKLYRTGEDRIESEMNIIKIMNTIRNIKIILKNSMMSSHVIS